MPRAGARVAWLEVLAVSLRLGLTSFGGPVAHIGYQRAELVTRRAWLDDAAFGELVALCQALPGPASSQLMIAAGRLRAGWAGGLAAWVGFTLPSALLMLLLGLLVAGAAVPDQGPVAGAIAGLKAAAVAVVAHAVVAMGRRLTPDLPRLAMAAAACVLALAAPVPATGPLLIVAGGLIGLVALRGQVMGATAASSAPGATAPIGATAASSAPGATAPNGATAANGVAAATGATGGARSVAVLAIAWVVVVIGSQAVAAATGRPELGFLAALVRAGALVFGGGHVVLPLLDAGVVDPGWVTPDAFLAGYGLAQALPGPLFSFAAYLGAISSSGPAGVAGAVTATLAIFLPGALLVLAALPVLRRLRERPSVAAALAGTNAVVVGILAAALVSPVATGGLTSPSAVAVAALGFAGLLARRVPPLLVVGASAVALGIVAATAP